MGAAAGEFHALLFHSYVSSTPPDGGAAIRAPRPAALVYRLYIFARALDPLAGYGAGSRIVLGEFFWCCGRVGLEFEIASDRTMSLLALGFGECTFSWWEDEIDSSSVLRI